VSDSTRVAVTDRGPDRRGADVGPLLPLTGQEELEGPFRAHRLGVGLAKPVRFDLQVPAGDEAGEADVPGAFMRQRQPADRVLDPVQLLGVQVLGHAC
jgi:hypothetical protein